MNPRNHVNEHTLPSEMQLYATIAAAHAVTFIDTHKVIAMLPDGEAVFEAASDEGWFFVDPGSVAVSPSAVELAMRACMGLWSRRQVTLNWYVMGERDTEYEVTRFEVSLADEVTPPTAQNLERAA